MSLRAKDMLSSVADDHDNNNGSSSPHSNGSAAGAARSNGSLGLFNNDNSSSASGILNGIADEVPTVPAVDEAEVCVSYVLTKCQTPTNHALTVPPLVGPRFLLFV